MEGTRATQARFRLRITRNDATGSARAEGRAQTEERGGVGGVMKRSGEPKPRVKIVDLDFPFIGLAIATHAHSQRIIHRFPLMA